MAKKILIIDDEADLVEMLKLRLEASGFEVDTAENGKIGLEKVASFKPDVVLVDLVMPILDGWETCRRIRKNPKTKDLPVYFLTAVSSQDLGRKVLEVGGNDVITKPCDEKRLVELMNSL